ncbi:hypothetical protein E0H77_12535 [Acinetobacter sp. ANC 4633]|uniref:hypothetical protein n=1 Tax=Acinetobacter sp. ANC 4633 TaxID=2529845 RepID=UPI00103A05DF|nr:hypothetical protein [Acinetobacter sp. ANC 4633]TCB23941.1 hypothetical protein E0H77_12535 [Acinetobacter sp. ANC 4633]
MNAYVKFKKFHDGQKAILNNNLPQFSVIRAGRRFGKTTGLEEWASAKATRGLKVGWFAPTFKLLHPTFARVKKTLKPVIERSSKTEWIIETKTGGCVEFWSLEDEDAGRSRNYDLTIIDEASLKAKGLREIWEQAIRPTLLDRDGSAILAGTPKVIDPENYFYLACTDQTLGWVEFHAPTMANPMLNQNSVARLKVENAPLVYQQEFLAEFVDWNGSAFFSESSMLVDGLSIPMPENCDQVYVVIDTALKDGLEHDGTAVTYYARNKYTGHKLIILDYDLVQIEGAVLEDWPPSVAQRGEDLERQCGAREGYLALGLKIKHQGLYCYNKRHAVALLHIRLMRSLPHWEKMGVR